MRLSNEHIVQQGVCVGSQGIIKMHIPLVQVGVRMRLPLVELARHCSDVRPVSCGRHCGMCGPHVGGNRGSGVRSGGRHAGYWA